MLQVIVKVLGGNNPIAALLLRVFKESTSMMATANILNKILLLI